MFLEGIAVQTFNTSTLTVRLESLMKMILKMLVLVVLGFSLSGCGDKDTPGPFGNNQGPKKPTQY